MTSGPTSPEAIPEVVRVQLLKATVIARFAAVKGKDRKALRLAYEIMFSAEDIDPETREVGLAVVASAVRMGKKLRKKMRKKLQREGRSR